MLLKLTYIVIPPSNPYIFLTSILLNPKIGDGYHSMSVPTIKTNQIQWFKTFLDLVRFHVDRIWEAFNLKLKNRNSKLFLDLLNKLNYLTS